MTICIYPGVSMAYFPSAVATPFVVENSEATSADETVMSGFWVVWMTS
ncbi:hypothetical protein FHX49_000679 [Microbacterium endophyticum]|uniref:Uncharacterized protein n=1 Tax=Microbacterium endophyticum TaxID=1526412 RepID=A0A7W4V2U6_9MICO|nr:hypothetical protein [Microbacterium endophyticum]MBB2975138.1 hypothetical protein [Microbacterium endophyticum]NIK37322.1 hypothetical protein [Microbacterium endophyticum]